MTKAQAVKALKQAITFGEASYVKSINETADSRRIEYVLSTLLQRIQSGFISHAEYQIPVNGIKWCLQTGRATYINVYLHKLDLQGILNFIENVKRSCETMSDVETYIANFRVAV